MIDIVIPTIAGRERWLDRCLASYQETTSNYTIHIIKGHHGCGSAWNEGWRESRGDYIHFSADDLEAHPGWWQAAIEVVGEGALPAPRILNPDGSTQFCGDTAAEQPDGTIVGFARIPFLSRAQAELVMPVPAIHYYTDVWISEIGRLHGFETVISRDYLFTHHFATEGRIEDAERIAQEKTTMQTEYKRRSQGAA